MPKPIKSTVSPILHKQFEEESQEKMELLDHQMSDMGNDFELMKRARD
jgi:hypothetical protein